ncbi:MAG: GC-type dockerin domain-anchored protein [Phycisphaerales bacterium JB040]
MKAKSALSLAVVAGVAASATAGNTPANRDIVPLRKAGVLYINMQTGERSLTLYNQGGEVPEVDVSNSTAALFDYWMCVDENPCWDDPRADGFGWNADATTDTTGPTPILEPVVGFDFGDMPFDSKISGVIMNTAVLATESVDSNNDGTNDTGLDVVTYYYDGLSEGNRTSIAPPTAVARVESIPGNRGEIPNGFSDYDLILDFGGAHFEMGDSDGANLGSLYLTGANPGFDFSATITVTSCTTPTGTVCTTFTTPNPSPDGLADFQFLQYYAQHNTDDKVTADSTFIGVGTPEGTVTFTTFTTSITTITTTTGGLTITTTVNVTVTNTFFTADPLPQGQFAQEGFGIGALGAGADAGNVDWSIGGCCFWFGGVDCAGFLAQVNDAVLYDATWYNFGPYAQNTAAFLSDSPDQSACLAIDYTNDGLLDNGDIGAFVGLFIAQDLSTDLNGDGVVDNGDIGAFVQLFIACTG